MVPIDSILLLLLLLAVDSPQSGHIGHISCPQTIIQS